MNNYPRHIMKKGFSIVEILVVIAIISLVTSIVFTNLKLARSKAKNAARRVDFKTLQTALELYKQDNGRYPPTVRAGGHRRWYDSQNCPNKWIPGLVPKYISALPDEPDQNILCLADNPPVEEYPAGTAYRYKSDGVSYKIHDHCAPITPDMTVVTNPLYHCPNNGTGHENSWSVCGGPIPCANLYCTSVTDNEDDQRDTNCNMGSYP